MRKKKRRNLVCDLTPRKKINDGVFKTRNQMKEISEKVETEKEIE